MQSRLADKAKEVDLESIDDLDYHSWLELRYPYLNWNWEHSKFISKAIDRIIRKEIHGLILNLPPRHGKTEQTTLRLPVYLFEKDPTLDLVGAAYNQRRADKYGRKTRRLVTENENIILDDKGRQAQAEWELVAGGSYRAVGVGGGITGEGANGIIIDDPIKNREEANSEAYRDKTWDWFTDDIYTRLESDGFIIIPVTRWHEDDIVGRIQASDFAHEFEIVNLPALAEKNDPLGRKVGEALCPERFDAEKLRKIKRVLGHSFYSLYQGSPAPQEGDLIKLEWFQRYRVPPVKFVRILQSVDTAQKDKELNDYSVFITAGQTENGDIYILNVFRQKMGYPRLKATAKALAMKYTQNTILIEDNGHGTALSQELRIDPKYKPSVIAISVHGMNKAIRMSSNTDMLEAGEVYLPISADWLLDFENEMINFPNGKNDDQVDGLSILLEYIQGHALAGVVVTSTTRRNLREKILSGY